MCLHYKDIFLSLQRFSPVSYTHLDVYKRQVQNNLQMDIDDEHLFFWTFQTTWMIST